MLAAMQFVAERILPAYLDALDRALEDALARLPEGALRATLMRLRRRGGREGAWDRFGALHRLAILGEAQGWLRPDEAIVIRKLAYRVAFLTMRAGARGSHQSLRGPSLDEG
jgi:hypothetical protein